MEETTVHDDWDQHWAAMADANARNPAQAMRQRLVLSLLRADGAGVRILDIGCGHGEMVARLRRRHPRAELCGIDYSQRGVDIARAKVPGARFGQRDLLQPGDPEPDLA